MRSKFSDVCLVGALIVSGCVADDATDVLGVSVRPGFSVEMVADGFNRPTQIAFTTDGRLVVGQLAGDEDAATGEVLLVDLGSADTPKQTVLQSGLAKPTGIAVIGETLWIMQERSLSYTSLEPGAELKTFLSDMPFNGRSEGSLTPTADGSLIFNTSGSKRGAVVVDGSGIIFVVNNADPIGAGSAPGVSAPIATGLKHGYAHTFDGAGQLWATEMTDGLFDGLPASDELMMVSAGDNFDWPACVENNRPVVEFGGSAERCDSAPASHALFGAQATPTSVKVAPWDSGTLVIALWVTDQIVTVPLAEQTSGQPWEPSELVSGVGRPQDLLVDGSRLLIVDHENGRILGLAAE